MLLSGEGSRGMVLPGEGSMSIEPWCFMRESDMIMDFIYTSDVRVIDMHIYIALLRERHAPALLPQQRYTVALNLPSIHPKLSTMLNQCPNSSYLMRQYM